MQNPPDFVLFFSCIFLHFFSCVSVCSHVQYIVWDLAVPPNRHLYHPSLYNTPERFWIGEEPMTEITGFRQSVRLFQSYDPVTPSILSSFLLHLSDAFPSGRVLLRLSVRHPYADSPTAVQALIVDFHHGSHASPRYRCFVIWLFPFPECLSTCDWFYPLLC